MEEIPHHSATGNTIVLVNVSKPSKTNHLASILDPIHLRSDTGHQRHTGGLRVPPLDALHPDRIHDLVHRALRQLLRPGLPEGANHQGVRNQCQLFGSAIEEQGRVGLGDGVCVRV